jgi:glutamate-1-semialdehyde 2,1-aminomutase/spore coat polysaccharide biosynthesis protein SpsF
MNFGNSQKFLQKAKKLIPSCTQTFSKGPTQFVQGVAPNFVSHADGCKLWDVDGNEFIDYTMALGPMILGYNYPRVNEAIVSQLKEGTTFTLPHKIEVELAELLVDIIPCAEMVRYGKNGSDVTSAAVRVARAFTGREKIACCGYHGWQDWYIGTTTRNEGVPKCVKDLTLTFEYNNIDSLVEIFDKHKDEIACVIMEPVSTIEPQDNFLEEVKKVTHENDAILVFDEVVTGFRIALGGAQEYYGVTPDLACFGKGMANGMPLSAIVGKREIMKEFEKVFFSFTFGGETLSIAAAIATINEIIDKNVIEHIWKIGRYLIEGIQKFIEENGLEGYVEIRGLPPRMVMTFKDEEGRESLEMKSLFQQECIKRGVLFTGAHNISLAHTEEIVDKTLEVYEECLIILQDGIEKDNIKEKLEGSVVNPVFRKI